MADQRIVQYINDNMRKGYKLPQLRAELLKAGYSTGSIDDAMASLGVGSSGVPKPPSASGPVPAVKKRGLVFVYVIGIITLGIYFLYWHIVTKDEMNRMGAKIPTAWLLIIPIANIYWLYKYAEGYSQVVRHDDNTILWFLLFWLVSIVTPAIVQTDLNKLAQ
jgi:hypothetical protein